MRKKVQIISAVLLILVMLLSVACQGGEKKPTDPAKTDPTKTDPAKTDPPTPAETPKLVWRNYCWSSVGTDTELVMNELEKLVKEKLGYDLDVIIDSYSEYGQKVKTEILSNQQIDILVTSNDTVPFEENVRQGNYLELENLIPATLKEGIPAGAWDAVTLNGHIYAVIPLKDLAEVHALQMDSALLKELGLEMPPPFDSILDVVDYLKDATQKRNEKYPDQKQWPSMKYIGGMPFNYYYRVEGFQQFAACNIPGLPGVKGKGNGEIVYNIYETDEFRQICHLQIDLIESGISPVDPWNFWKREGLPIKYLGAHEAGLLIPSKNVNPDFELTLNKSSLSYGDYIRAQLLAIMKKSKFPEEAMKVLELFSTDPLLATTARFGIKDTHWKQVDETTLSFEGTANEDLTNPAFYYWYGSTFGSMKPLILPPDQKDLIPAMLKMTAESNAESNMGFIFDPSSVEGELKAVQSVVAEFMPPLRDGLITKDKIDAKVDEFIAKMKANGSDKVIAELQKQLTEWRKSVGRKTA